MGLFHLEVLEEMAHAVTAVQRTADDMIEAKAGFSVFDHIPERRRQVDWSGSESGHGLTDTGWSFYPKVME
jgi:esterase/lipase